jgi:hypothetical protein
MPIVISVPAGRPAWSAISRSRSPEIVPRAAGGLPPDSTRPPSTSSVPQSPTGSCWLGAAATGCPSTRRPVTVEEPTSAVALADPAAALARTETESAAISPAKSSTETPSASA